MSSQSNTVAVITACVAMGLFNADRAVAQFASENVSLYSNVTLAELGSSFAEDCWGYVSPSGREYAIIGVSWYPASSRAVLRAFTWPSIMADGATMSAPASA